MTAPSNANTSGLDHFGWWVEHTVAEPMFIRPPAFCPDGDNYTITPLVTAASAQARIDAAEARADRLKVDKLAIISLIEGACKLPPQSAVNTLREATRLARAALQQETQK